MDLGLNNGLFTNTPNGVHNGIYTGTNNGVFNGVYNEDLITNGIVIDGLIVYVDMANPICYPTNSTSIADITPNKINATLLNTVTNNPQYNKLNKGNLTFNGLGTLGELLQFNSSALYGFNQNNSFTLAGWFFITSNMLTATYFGKWGTNGSGTGSYMLWNNGTGSNTLSFSVANLSTTAASTPNITFRFNRWNYFVGVYTSLTKLECYLNNTNYSTVSYTGNINNPSVNLRVNRFDAVGDQFTGRMAMVKLYNKALTAAEINQNFLATKARFYL